MPEFNVETVFIVGAGFSHHAGLPLTSGFTKAILEARGFGGANSHLIRSGAASRTIVAFLTRFIHDTFDLSTKAGAGSWPELEDIFTCVDLAANSGHHLGSSFSPADLRTVRRALLSRIIRMLDEKYEAARRKKSPDWKKLDEFFVRIESRDVGFISMNWDTVIERKLNATQSRDFLLDYGCGALQAAVPDQPRGDELPRGRKAYLKALEKGLAVVPETPAIDEKKVKRIIPIVKIHGSTNWLYCDNCRRLFCFRPDESIRIANQLLRIDDLSRIDPRRWHDASGDAPQELSYRFRELRCTCPGDVPLSTRIATFSYRKALDFPMFQKSWFAAEELLRTARRWVFVGYSLPPADYEFKYMLKRVQLSRKTQPKFVIISGGGKGDVSQTYNNYRKFFGRSINRASFHTAGLSSDAVSAILT